MPSGRTLQLGSIHQYKDNFAKPYEITYENEQGDHVFCHQTTYGMSERLLGAIIGIHGDNKGLILPPDVAPNQVVIVPIIFKDKKQDVIKASEHLLKKLHDSGIRGIIDDREITPGNKYYDWELKGVPVRIEIGPRDLENNQVTIVPRDNGEKHAIAIQSAISFIQKELDQLSGRLLQKATNLLSSNIHVLTTVEEAEGYDGIIQLPWCGTDDCALTIEERIEKSTLGTPIDHQEEITNKSCPICGQSAEKWMRYAKTY
jgi:prolyl-tRNA synthetase